MRTAIVKQKPDPYTRAIWRTFTTFAIVGLAVVAAFVLLMFLA